MLGVCQQGVLVRDIGAYPHLSRLSTNDINSAVRRIPPDRWYAEPYLGVHIRFKRYNCIVWKNDDLWTRGHKFPSLDLVEILVPAFAIHISRTAAGIRV